jgi:predicted ATP-grasp superfamily ATP-dependent carboligase
MRDKLIPGTEENLVDYSVNKTKNNEVVGCSSRSPLRYPGGKTRGVEFITRFFSKEPGCIIITFFWRRLN